MLAQSNGRNLVHRRRERALQVSGVGNGSQRCNYDCDLPIAIRPRGQNRLQNGILKVPAVQDSDLPGLMGLTALRKNRAILDFNTQTLYFCGEAQYNLEEMLPQGTDRYQLETAPSGHLVLPCCEYKVGSDNSDYSLTLIAGKAQPPTVAGPGDGIPAGETQGKASGAVRGRPEPPRHCPPDLKPPTDQIPPPPVQPADPHRGRGRRDRSRQTRPSRS